MNNFGSPTLCYSTVLWQNMTGAGAEITDKGGPGVGAENK